MNEGMDKKTIHFLNYIVKIYFKGLHPTKTIPKKPIKLSYISFIEKLGISILFSVIKDNNNI